MTGVQLAQVNLARLRFPLDAPQTRQFVAAVDRINRLAEQSAGFVWRYQTGEAHPSAAEETGDPLMLINLSVWRSYEHLHAYVYRSRHGHYVRRRYEWFEKIATPATALWWVPAGHHPTPPPAEGLSRLAYLRAYGPTPKRSRCGADSPLRASGSRCGRRLPGTARPIARLRRDHLQRLRPAGAPPGTPATCWPRRRSASRWLAGGWGGCCSNSGFGQRAVARSCPAPARLADSTAFSSFEQKLILSF